MSREAHTAGPWFVNLNGSDSWSVDYDGPSSSYVTISGQRSAPIAFAVEASAYGGDVDANARLIAAAPALLEALTEAQAHWHHMIGLSSPAGWHRLNEKMTAAIHSATGEG